MIKKIKYVLFAGEAGSGKTFNAKRLKEYIDTEFSNGGSTVAYVESFAKPLKEAANVLIEELFSKKYLLPIYKEKVRPLYQGLGLAAREINSMFWVNKLKINVEKMVFEIDKCTEGVDTLVVLIDDVRFYNELLEFGNDSIKIKITRPSSVNVVNKSDPSEMGIDDAYFDIVIPELNKEQCLDLIERLDNE